MLTAREGTAAGGSAIARRACGARPITPSERGLPSAGRAHSCSTCRSFSFMWSRRRTIRLRALASQDTSMAGWARSSLSTAMTAAGAASRCCPTCMPIPIDSTVTTAIAAAAPRQNTGVDHSRCHQPAAGSAAGLAGLSASTGGFQPSRASMPHQTLSTGSAVACNSDTPARRSCQRRMAARTAGSSRARCSMRRRAPPRSTPSAYWAARRSSSSGWAASFMSRPPCSGAAVPGRGAPRT
ncbi:hypothetical protein D9M69_502600 [compost metagenome]